MYVTHTQSILTGESYGVDKVSAALPEAGVKAVYQDKINMLFSVS